MRSLSCLWMLKTKASSAGRNLSCDKLPSEKSAENTMNESKVKERNISASRLLVMSFFICVLINCSEDQASNIIIKDPHLYVPLKGSSVTGGYLSISNKSKSIIKINGIDCYNIKAEIHETKMNTEGRMSMKKVNSLELEPGSTDIFMPGGKHIMFWGLSEYNEEYLKCKFLVSEGKPIDIRFLVEKRG